MNHPSHNLLDDQEAQDSVAYEQGYEQGQRYGVVLGFFICLLLFGAALLL